jgi:hypothetical protein
MIYLVDEMYAEYDFRYRRKDFDMLLLCSALVVFTLGFAAANRNPFADMVARFSLAMMVLWLSVGSAEAQQKRSGQRFVHPSSKRSAAKLTAAKLTATAENKLFEDQFWKYLIGNNYKNWSPGPDQSGDFYIGQNPHGALLKMYLNRTAAGNPQNFPMGSVVILENYRSDKSLKTISVMYRTEGFDPQGNDWYWIEYHPDGTVVKAPVDAKSQVNNVSFNDGHLQKTMGRAANCIACHQKDSGSDFVFFNDKTKSPLHRGSANRVANKVSVGGSR